MNFPDEHYNVYVLDYDPEFMKLFYNSIDMNKIEAMTIVFDFNSNTVDRLGNQSNEYADIMIRSKDSKDYYIEENFAIVLVIEDYIN